jgi:hypothetical protein
MIPRLFLQKQHQFFGSDDVRCLIELTFPAALMNPALIFKAFKGCSAPGQSQADANRALIVVAVFTGLSVQQIFIEFGFYL